MKNLIKTNALVLKKRNYGEYDRILWLLTADYGRIDVLARGVRKPGARMSGLCESFLLLKVEIEQRRGFDILKDAELANDFKVLERSLIGLGVGELLMEVVEMLSNFGQDDETIFNLLNEYLWCFERNKIMMQNKLNIELFLSSFLMSVLAVSGRLPLVEGCLECGKTDVEEYCMTEFGLCCAACLHQGVSLGKIDAKTGHLYQQIATLSCDSLLTNYVVGDTTIIMKYCLQLFDLFHKKEIKSFNFLNNVYKNL